VLEAYFDESGSHAEDSTSFLLLAGYVAEAERWRVFETRWKEVLQGFRLERFHTKDLRNFRHSSLKHLDAADRRTLVKALSDLVADTAVLGTLHYLRPADYKAVTDAPFRSRHGSAYGMLVTLTLLQLDAVLLNPLCVPETIGVFLEEGHANANDALRLLEYWQQDSSPPPPEVEGYPAEVLVPDPARFATLRIHAYGLGSKATMHPLHAADMLAYLAFSAMTFKGDDFLTDVFNQLLPRVTHLSTSWNRAALEGLVRSVADGEQTKAAIRADLYAFKRHLRSHGVTVQQYPWGITIDGRHLTEGEWQRTRAALKDDASRGALDEDEH
jgi:hypothetical protein